MNRTNNGMDNATIQRSQRKLEAYRDETLRFLTRADAERRMLDRDDPQDFGDRCVTGFSREFLFQRSSQKRQLLQMIEEALRRIDDETFGECIGCGDNINGKRLEAMPWTQYCLQCQEQLEQGDRGELHARPLSGVQARI
jgi:RNA polymerase-binding transcription factor